MDDRLLQEVGVLIYEYYRARGRGLEKTCRSVVAAVESYVGQDAALTASNVFKLDSSNIDSLTYRTNDKLLVYSLDHLMIYHSTIGSLAYNVPLIKECDWVKDGDQFANPSVKISEILSRGASVYLLRDT